MEIKVRFEIERYSKIVTLELDNNATIQEINKKIKDEFVFWQVNQLRSVVIIKVKSVKGCDNEHKQEEILNL